MLHKYYYDGKSRRNNDKFFSPTDSTYTIPYARESIRRVLEHYSRKLNLSRFRRILYLEKPDNTNRYWKAVIAIWNCGDPNITDFDPERVIRVTFDDFSDLVKDKFTQQYVADLPISVFHRFLKTGYYCFY